MIWEVLQNPRNRSLWWRRIRRGCGIILLLILLFSCLSCILLGVLVGRAGATGPDTGLSNSRFGFRFDIYKHFGYTWNK